MALVRLKLCVFGNLDPSFDTLYVVQSHVRSAARQGLFECAGAKGVASSAPCMQLVVCLHMFVNGHCADGCGSP